MKKEILFTELGNVILTKQDRDTMYVIEGEREVKPAPLYDYDHTGDIPKGCTLERKALTFAKGEYYIGIYVDLVFSTKKGKLKKLKRIYSQLLTYLNTHSVEEIIATGKFIVKKKEEAQP